jgi:hypothetical protein
MAAARLVILAAVRGSLESGGELNDASKDFGERVRDVSDAETRQGSAGPS